MLGYRFWAFCQPFDEDSAHGHVDEGLASFRQPFIVFGQTSISGEPCECSFNNPPGFCQLLGRVAQQTGI